MAAANNITNVSDLKTNRYHFNTDDYFHNLLKTTQNNITVGKNDYLFIIPFGLDWPSELGEDDHQPHSVEERLDKIISRNLKYLVKLNPVVHTTYQDLVHEFILGAKKTIVDDSLDNYGNKLNSVYDFYAYYEFSMHGSVTVYSYKGARYWDIDYSH